MTENERLTHVCGSGIKLGHWSSHKKDELIERLAAYEDTGVTPEQIRAMLKAGGLALAAVGNIPGYEVFKDGKQE